MNQGIGVITITQSLRVPFQGFAVFRKHIIASVTVAVFIKVPKDRDHIVIDKAIAVIVDLVAQLWGGGVDQPVGVVTVLI